MTISSTTRKAGPFSGNGVTVAFPFTFKVFQASDLLVVQTDASGVETTQTLTSQYAVSLNANQDSNPGGTVTMVAAPAIGTLLTIGSQVAQTQPAVLTNTGGFYPTVVNDMLDRATILVQQLSEKIGRTVSLAFSDPSNLNATLPAAAQRAGKALVFDGAGNVGLSTAPYDDQAGSAAGSAAAALVSKNAAAASAATASAQAALASTAKLGADTSKAGADTAKAGAESARDAALIQAGVYTTEPLGRAAVADGAAFKVQGSGDVAAFEYRRVNSGSSTLIATYPSKSLIDTIGDRSQPYYYEGELVQEAILDSAGRAAFVVTPDGSVKIPSLKFSTGVQAAIGVLANRKATWPTNALEALGFAARRRVDLVMLGDSNQLKDGTGWDHGFNKGLTERFGMYATAIYGVSDTTGVQQGGPNAGGGGYFGAPTGAPSSLESKDLASEAYGFIPGGSTMSSGFNGVGINNVTGVDVSAQWRMHFAYGTFTTGSGSFQPGIRRGDSPFTVLASSPLINTNAGAETYVLGSLDMPAVSRSALAIEFKWYVPGGTQITGPFLGFFARAENVLKTAGVSVHTLYGVGGQSLYDYAAQLLTYDNTKLQNYFSEVRRLQLSAGQKPIVVVYINSGLNDQNETSTPSWGYRASTTPDSAVAYIDNLDAIAKRIEDIWERAGWDKSELFYLLMPSHPISNPDAAKLVSYRKAATVFASSRQRSSFVDLTNLTTSTEILANGWYLSGGTDTNHLTQAAYETLAARVVNLVPTVSA